MNGIKYSSLAGDFRFTYSNFQGLLNINLLIFGNSTKKFEIYYLIF